MISSLVKEHDFISVASLQLSFLAVSQTPKCICIMYASGMYVNGDACMFEHNTGMHDDESKMLQCDHE